MPRRVNTSGHPDYQSWKNVQGVNRGNNVVVFKIYGTSDRLKIIFSHEIWHATKSSFKGDIFGIVDHSSSGLMTLWESSNTFSSHDKKYFAV
jgi:hypothetical protein